MGKFSGVLLASDYDETLYGVDVGVSPANKKAIQYFISEGGYFTVSTGRICRNFAIQMQRESLLVNAPVILSNGASIYDFQKEEMLLESHMREGVARDVWELCQAFPELGFEAYSDEGAYIHNPNAVTMRHLERAGLSGIEMPILEMPQPWTKVILQQLDHDLLLKAQDYAQKRWGEQYEIIFSNDVLLEMTAKGVHKGAAVLWVAKKLGITKEHIYCIGNGQNDIPMLDVSAEAFAPSNCIPAIRDYGATILTSCRESCVAALIEVLDHKYPCPLETA